MTIGRTEGWKKWHIEVVSHLKIVTLEWFLRYRLMGVLGHFWVFLTFSWGYKLIAIDSFGFDNVNQSFTFFKEIVWIRLVLIDFDCLLLQLNFKYIFCFCIFLYNNELESKKNHHWIQSNTIELNWKYQSKTIEHNQRQSNTNQNHIQSYQSNFDIFFDCDCSWIGVWLDSSRSIINFIDWLPRLLWPVK